MKILVSACLMGVDCRYNGKGVLYDGIEELMKKHELIPVCPEIFGGMPTPREPAEQKNGRVITSGGNDFTEEFEKGAQEVLRLAKLYQCTCCILKERSPSCGHDTIYDGTFSHTIISGDGVLGGLLKANGIKIYGESEIEMLLQ